MASIYPYQRTDVWPGHAIPHERHFIPHDDMNPRLYIEILSWCVTTIGSSRTPDSPWGVDGTTFWFDNPNHVFEIVMRFNRPEE